MANKILVSPGSSRHGIDGSYVTIEVATPEHYRLYSYWSPWSSSSSKNEGAQDVVKMMALTNNFLDLSGHTSNFLESLEPGNYPWGMTGLRIDKFLPENARRSTLYKTLEKRARKELKITPETSHQKYPIVIINHQRAFLKDLNKYETADVSSLQILSKDNSQHSIYGSLGENGVIVVETK
ncbi:hypothetical protein [Sabulibacter ruber]|uniref:hypothetical protein n=1 Tax=Sabulibacter ruber TaxID=2811901 RepID=UPI001A978912|nr:hypothetical protein [Sabulibacter ruber]